MLDNWQGSHKWAKIFLDGYLKTHKHHCKRADCPVRYKNKRNIIIRKKLAEIMKIKSRKLTE
jgi:hypothetical protein